MLKISIVITINHSEQNRVVHLARRDVYFERAMERIRALQLEFISEICITDYEEILFLLRVARKHAHFTSGPSGKNEKDKQFWRFIKLMSGNVKAVLAMMNLKQSVESEDSSLLGFLGANQASVGLQAEEYQRRANDIIRSIYNTLELADGPFEQLKQENYAGFSDEDRERYEKARKHFESLIKEGRHRFVIAPSIQKIVHF